MIRVRESFAAKLLLGLLGTVCVFVVLTYVVVRSETNRQVVLTAERAVENAATQFQELEEIQRQQVRRVARPLTEGRRTLAALDEAIEAGDRSILADLAAYELDLAALTDLLVVFSDARGRSILTMHGDEAMGDSDPAHMTAVAKGLLEGDEREVRNYRVVEGALFGVTTRIIQLAGRPIGTLSLGLPIEDADVQRIGDLVRVEVCFVVEGRCVAGTPTARESLAATMASMADLDEEARVTALNQIWSVRAQPLIERDPSQGTRIVAVPLNEVLAPFRRITQALLYGGGAAFLLSILVGVLLSRGLAQPVRALVAATGRVAEGDYETEVRVGTRDELARLADAFNDMTRGLLLKERYRSVLNKVVSRDVAHELMQGEVELGGENRRITVLFADIRGFSALTDGMEPQDVIALLNECMQRLSDAVEQEGGVVDKYVGDEVMAVFGAPASQEDHAVRAVRAALRMQASIAELNDERRARGDTPLGIGVGINTGVAVAGNMGSKERLNYTVLGDVVNLASRLCGTAGPGSVLATEATVAEAGDEVSARRLGGREMRGFSSEVEVYEVTEPTSGERPGTGTALSTILMVAAASGILAAGTSAQSLPTLRDLGAEYISPTGAFQVTLSGQLDLEGLSFSGQNSGLAYGGGELLAPRVRLFTDLFLGDHLYALLEVRADRGEAPTVGVWEARVEQAFVRYSDRRGLLSLQFGRFASPFGSYATRHLTPGDPFVRPPLPYDYRTLASRYRAPPSTTTFLDWTLDPATYRHDGAPPIWGVPYQWGAMASGASGALSYRAAAMNSAPSSEPEAWGFDVDRMKHPSLVLGMGLRVFPSLELGASYNRGPWLEEITLGALREGQDRWDYAQEMASFDVTYARGPVVARGEVIRDRWQVPNLPEDPVEWGYSAEVQTDVGGGVSVGARLGWLDFRPVTEGNGAREWDFDLVRYEASVAYRLARNAGVLSSFALNRQRSETDVDDDLWAVRLWWAF